MIENPSLCLLVSEWATYLKQHDHQVQAVADAPAVLLSRNGSDRKYRWLLRYTKEECLRMTPTERKELKRQMRLAQNVGEKAYVVILFERPVRKLLVVPASEAVKTKPLTAAKGGIPWED